MLILKKRIDNNPTIKWHKLFFSTCLLTNEIQLCIFFSPWIIYWWKNDHMCCDLAESVRSWEHWLWDKARKRTVFPLFSIVLRILQLLIVLEPQVQFSWDFQQNDLSKLALQSNKKTENVTCSTLDLIPLDHIKYLPVQWKLNFFSTNFGTGTFNNNEYMNLILSILAWILYNIACSIYVKGWSKCRRYTISHLISPCIDLGSSLKGIFRDFWVTRTTYFCGTYR